MHRSLATGGTFQDETSAFKPLLGQLHRTCTAPPGDLIRLLLLVGAVDEVVRAAARHRPRREPAVADAERRVQELRRHVWRFKAVVQHPFASSSDEVGGDD